MVGVFTSITAVSTYQAMGVPEIWVYRHHTLKINLLAGDHCIEVSTSPT